VATFSDLGAFVQAVAIGFGLLYGIGALRTLADHV
jgi:hypothetical protein